MYCRQPDVTSMPTRSRAVVAAAHQQDGGEQRAAPSRRDAEPPDAGCRAGSAGLHDRRRASPERVTSTACNEYVTRTPSIRPAAITARFIDKLIAIGLPDRVRGSGSRPAGTDQGGPSIGTPCSA